MSYPDGRLLVELKNLFLLLFGSAFVAFGVVLFLVPNQIATGGTPGMAILLHFLTGLPIGGLMIMINLPLLLVGAKLLGKAFAIRTVIAILLTSFLVDLFAEILQLQALSQDTLLATIYGGIAVGIGVGLVLLGNASAGGSTIIARIVAARSRFRHGQVILAIDLLIIISSGLVFHDIERALWSLISIYVTTKCIDILLTGAPAEKVVHITTDQADVLSQQIVARLGRQGTILHGTDLDKQQEKTLVFVTVEARRIALLRDIIKENDPAAFMVVMDAAEMLGRGHGT